MPDQKQQPLTCEELLAIIEQAARKKKTELDLSGRGITELPAEIGQLVKLTILNLSNPYSAKAKKPIDHTAPRDRQPHQAAITCPLGK